MANKNSEFKASCSLPKRLKYRASNTDQDPDDWAEDNC